MTISELRDMETLARNFVRSFYLVHKCRMMQPMIDLRIGEESVPVLLDFSDDQRKTEVIQHVNERHAGTADAYIMYGEAFARGGGRESIDVCAVAIAKSNGERIGLVWELIRDSDGIVVDLMERPGDVLFSFDPVLRAP